LICPYCKNEKWDEALCPQCGLDQSQAILKTALDFQAKEKWLQAIEFYDRFLTDSVDNLEAQKKKAYCFFRYSQIQPSNENLQTSDTLIKNILDIDWGWENGHQYRLQIYDLLDRLEQLEKEYDLNGENELLGEVSRKMTQTIKLFRKFKNALPASGSLLPHEDETHFLIFTALPVLLGIFFIWYIITYLRPKSSPEFSSFLLLMGFIFTGVLLFLCYREYRQKRSGPKSAK